jgi:hypothetical protein
MTALAIRGAEIVSPSKLKSANAAEESMKDTALLGVSRWPLFSCLLIVCALYPKPASAFHSKPPLAVHVETGRNDPAPGCNKDVDGCVPKVFIPQKEFKAGARVWMRVTIANRSRLQACNQAWDTFEVRENSTGAEPEHVKGDTIVVPMITASPPDANFCIAPHLSSSIRIIEITHTYILDKPGVYKVRVAAHNFGLTSARNLGHDNPLYLNYYRNEKAVKRIDLVQSEPVEFSIDSGN